jgi:alkylated DNA repair dioxygenase AlkB
MPRIDLPDADLRYEAEWIERPRADALFAELLAEVPWERHRPNLFGREIDAPRLSSWIGDPDATYTYSRVRFEPRRWTPTLAALRDDLASRLGIRFNSVLANLYRDGRDSMGWHSDAERELGPRPVIASLSLGAPRRFRLRDRRDRSRGLDLDLAHGSLLLMAGDTQTYYRHDLPRCARVCQARINLTFRRIMGRIDEPGTRR